MKKKKTVCSAAFLAGTVFMAAGAASAEEVPAADLGGAPTAPHTVAAGENLWSISRTRLGAAERWMEVYLFNQDVLASPDLIEVGQVLRIPSGPVEVPAGARAGLGPGPAQERPAAADRTPAPRASKRKRAKSVRAKVVRARSVGRGASPGGGAGLAGIRSCESGGNYQAVSPSGKYRGAYQFDQRTWRSVGGSGDPAAASPAEQDARAQRLKSQRGSSPWANCG